MEKKKSEVGQRCTLVYGVGKNRSLNEPTRRGYGVRKGGG